MLPGFRFLFAAILLSISILVFALGAAALLRATHEQFANDPSWRTGPQEQVFAQASEPAQPVLAAFRAEPEMSAPATSVRDQIPTVGLPEREPEQTAALLPQAAAEASQQAEASEPAQTEPAADTPAVAATPAEPETTAAIPDSKAAETDIAWPVTASAAPNETQQASVASASPGTDGATAKVAALSDPTTAGKEPPANAQAASGTPEKAAKKRAHPARKHHRVVRRPPPPPPAQQTFDPFAQQPVVATATTRTR